MALNATQILGASEIAATKVNPPGLRKRIMARSMFSSGGGLAAVAVTSVIDAAVRTKFERDASKQRVEAAHSSAPRFPKIAWLAATANELALLEVSTATTLKLTGTILARSPRAQVNSAEMRKGNPLSARAMTVRFADGQEWIFEIPTGSKKAARRLAGLFDGDTPSITI